MKENYFNRIHDLTQSSFGIFEDFEIQIDFLRKNGVFRQLTEQEFFDYKEVLRYFFEEKILCDQQKDILCLEKEFFYVKSESLADTEERVLKWLQAEYPFWKSDSNILIVSHSNTLRGLLKFLLGIQDNMIKNLYIPTGKPMLLELEGLDVKNGEILGLDQEHSSIEDWFKPKDPPKLEEQSKMNSFNMQKLKLSVI